MEEGRLLQKAHNVLTKKILTLMAKQEAIEVQVKAFKDSLLQIMREHGIMSSTVGDYTFTRILASQKETLDTKRLKEERPEIANAYIKYSDTAEYLRINKRKAKEA